MSYNRTFYIKLLSILYYAITITYIHPSVTSLALKNLILHLRSAAAFEKEETERETILRCINTHKHNK